MSNHGLALAAPPATDENDRALLGGGGDVRVGPPGSRSRLPSSSSVTFVVLCLVSVR